MAYLVFGITVEIKSQSFTFKTQASFDRHTQVVDLILFIPAQRYSNAAVVPSVRACVVPSFRPSVVDLVNTIETKPLHISLSNLADMLTMMRG